MGLSIHYNGRFNTAASLKNMIEEVKDIAKILKWRCFVFEEEFPANSLGLSTYNKEVYGVCFSPPECEPVYLSFLSNGRMSSNTNLQLYGNKESKEAEYLYMLSTKTQYAGVEIHKQVIHLLKHLSQKYLLDFNVSDEGYYWETGDEKLLTETFNRYTNLIDTFTSSLKSSPKKSGEGLEAYIERLLKKMRDKNE